MKLNMVKKENSSYELKAVTIVWLFLSVFQKSEKSVLFFQNRYKRFVQSQLLNRIKMNMQVNFRTLYLRLLELTIVVAIFLFIYNL